MSSEEIDGNDVELLGQREPDLFFTEISKLADLATIEPDWLIVA
jgi:hypothetical protein